MLVVDKIAKSYTSVSGELRPALSASSFAVNDGEFLSIVGPSGCGKSTLLMIVGGLLEPSTGSVSLDGELIDGPPAEVAVVFQDYARSLFPWFTVRRNLALACSAYRLSGSEVDERLARALHAVGLPDVARMYPWQLSGGMQQRVAIARALVVQPKLMLMDEPLAAVDAQTRADLEDLVLRVRAEYGMTVVFVTHDIDEAVYMADRVVVMASGPGCIKEIIDVDLPRPRDQVGTKADPRYAELRSRVFGLVMRRSADVVDEAAVQA